MLRTPHALDTVGTVSAIDGEALDSNQQGERCHVCSMIRARMGNKKSVREDWRLARSLYATLT